MTKKIIIATGGTGGHIFPAYSLANNLEQNYDLILTTDNRGFQILKNYINLNLKNSIITFYQKKYFYNDIINK